ncbi:hAT family dimerization domain protein [Metarhizium robertsii]|uniref:HAT family dimerization domain protein n=1 Tax=Metarhizium robertsii TaxID=568076 RepID=A0A014P0L8_9HYPO|nr:hAT family dimerization domain protein [Metarhizium robertsii]
MGTQNAERHLWEQHKVQDPSGKRSAPASRKKSMTGYQTITKAFNLDLTAPREQAIANRFIKSFDRNVFQRLVVEWIVEGNLSFREPENKRLRTIFEYLNPLVASTDAHVGHDTIRKRAVAEFEKHKGKVIEVLRNAPGLVHISFDGWRSRNKHALYGVTCFFRGEDGQARKLILGVPELTVRHFGANIGHEIIEILESYEISDKKIGYFILDNAPNNDTAMKTIGERFGFCSIKRRGRCFGHVINLVVKAILFGKDIDAFEGRLGRGDMSATTEHELWRKKGPVGKLHNLVVAIHRSDVLTTLLRSIQQLEFDASEDPRIRIRKPLNVVVDNETRWLSQFYMIRRALKLRPYLETLVLKHKQEWEKENTSKRSGRLKANAVMPAICREENKLDDKDWAVLDAFGTILQSFEDARRGGHFEFYGNVWDVIVGYEFLLAELEKAKAMVNQYPEPERFSVNINLGWKKLDEYYNRLDETPIYYTSLALHPAYRWGYFETVWSGRPEWISRAKDMVQLVWDRGYKTLDISVEEQGEPATKRRRTQYYSPFEQFKDEARIRPCEERDSDEAGDEYTRWQKDLLPTDGDVRDPQAYWHAQRFKYPRLSRMALDFMTAQAMSAECERLFSAAGRMVTPLRNQLEASTIAICQVLRSWLQAGIVDEVDPILLDKADEAVLEQVIEEEGIGEWLKGLQMQTRKEEAGWE